MRVREMLFCTLMSGCMGAKDVPLEPYVDTSYSLGVSLDTNFTLLSNDGMASVEKNRHEATYKKRDFNWIANIGGDYLIPLEAVYYDFNKDGLGPRDWFLGRFAYFGDGRNVNFSIKFNDKGFDAALYIDGSMRYEKTGNLVGYCVGISDNEERCQTLENNMEDVVIEATNIMSSLIRREFLFSDVETDLTLSN